MSTPSRSASCRASAFGRTLKPTTSAFEVGGEHDVALGDPADALVDHVDAHLGMLDLRQLGDRASTEPPTSPLRTMFRSWTAPSCSCEKSVSSETPPFERCASCSVRSRWPRRCASCRASRSFSTTRASSPAGGGTSKPRISTGVPGPRFLDLLAAVVVERAHLAVRVAGDDRVADAQRAAVHEHRRDRAAADVEARLDDRAGRLGVRIRGQLELGVRDEQHLLEQVVEVRLLLRGDVRELDGAAPVLGLQALGGEVGLDAVRVGVRHVHLVHGDDDRHAGGAGVGDRLLGLRHDAVVGGDDEDGDVRHLRAAGAHGGERLVARRVEERDLPAVDLGLVGADVLRDPAGLGLDDRGLADRVEQRRLAVVDVTHDRDDRRPRREILLGVLEDLRQLLLVGGVLDRDLAVELGPDQLDLLVGERLGDLDHLAEAHHDLDQLRGRDAERLREVPDGDAGRNGRGTGRRRDLLLLALRHRIGAAAVVARVRDVGPALDHDAALTPGRSLAGPDRAVWLVRFVSHQRSV